ncbi:MAG: DUF308 domain-containing protein [Flavitalea sp.]
MGNNYLAPAFKTGPLLFLVGGVFISIGIVSLIAPMSLFIHLIRYSGFALLISGIFLLSYAFAGPTVLGEAKWLITESIIDLLFGATLIFNPFLAAIAFPIIIGYWICIRSGLRILWTIFMRARVKGWIFVLGAALISFVFGFIMIRFSFENRNSVSIAVAVFTIIIGFIYVLYAITFRKKESLLIALM